jgi:lipopolysaccharide export system protein LptC
MTSGKPPKRRPEGVRVDQAGETARPDGQVARVGARAYLKARRHSARVRFFRRAIPVGAALAIGAVAVIAIFDPFGRMGGLTLGPVSITGTKIKMEHPRLSGYKKDTRPYEVTATAAFQDVRKPTLIELNEMKGHVAIDDNGALARFEALFGIFDTQKEQLDIRDNIYVYTENGQEARLKSAHIDFKAGTVASKEPVQVKLPNATVDADAIDMSDNGKMISFIGNVHTFIQSLEPAPASSPKPTPEGAAKPAQTSQAEPASLRP